MTKRNLNCLAAVLVLAAAAAPARAADEYTIDATHAAVNFKISHLGLSWTFGRFNDFSGTFTLDSSNPANSSFNMTVNVESLDTNNKQRDDHLRSPDFFNAKQFPTMSFKSTTVKPMDNGFQVTGDLTIHGVTKSVTMALVGGRKAEFPKGIQRTGYTTELTIKRSDFGIDKFKEMLSDEVVVAVSFEGTKK